MAPWGETSPEAASAGGSSDGRDRVAGARGRAAARSLSSLQLQARWPLGWVLGVFRKLLQGSEVGQRTC